MQRPAWYVSHTKSSPRPVAATKRVVRKIVRVKKPAIAAPRFSQLLAQTDNQFTLFSKEQDAIKNLAKAKAALAAIESKAHSTAAERARAGRRLVVRKVIKGPRKAIPKSKSGPLPAAHPPDRRQEVEELQQAGQYSDGTAHSIHDGSDQYSLSRFREKGLSTADAEAAASTDMRMRQRMFASGRIFTHKAKTHRVDLSSGGAALTQGGKPSEIEDCVGCKFIWMQVEMDVGGARFVEDVQASFEHNCMDAQKSTIFYGVCEDMYDDMYAMTDDYMTNTFPVDAICKRAKMCK